MERMFRKHIDKRVQLTDNEFALVMTHITMKRVKKHSFLIREGDYVPACFFVVSGLLRLTHTNESGKQYIVSFAMEDWWECDFDAFLTQARSTMSLDCLEDTVLFCLSLGGFKELCTNLPKLERFFLTLSIRGHSTLQRRLLSLMTTQAKERYEQLIGQYPSLVQRVPKHMLAAYLGVSRETLSRLSS